MDGKLEEARAIIFSGMTTRAVDLVLVVDRSTVSFGVSTICILERKS